MIKEQTLATLRAMGFEPSEVTPSVYRFEYEGLNILYAAEEDEVRCLPLVVPDIYELTEENTPVVLEAIPMLCGSVKYVQPVIMFEKELWLNYQHFLGDHEVTPELIEHMLKALAYAAVTFHELIEG